MSSDEPAFTDERQISSFKSQKVLKLGDDGRYAVVQGSLDGKDCLVELKLSGGFSSKEVVMREISGMNLKLTNHSGAEYSYYNANLSSDAESYGNYRMEVIWPASDRQIQRKTPSDLELMEESAEVYERVVQAHAAAQAKKLGWVEQICSMQKERERLLFNNERFLVNVDTKWGSHPDLVAARMAGDAEAADVADPPLEWRGADFTRELYLLAMSKDPALMSLRDLHGEDGAALCDEMKSQLRRVAQEVYSVQASQLRIFFHYHPQFYRLHAHCCRIEHVNPGSEAERAHLLSTVAHNLRLDGDYYRKSTLVYKLRVGEKLHSLLTEDGLAAGSPEAKRKKNG